MLVRAPRGHYNSPILSYGGSEGCESISTVLLTDDHCSL